MFDKQIEHNSLFYNHMYASWCFLKGFPETGLYQTVKGPPEFDSVYGLF